MAGLAFGGGDKSPAVAVEGVTSTPRPTTDAGGKPTTVPQSGPDDGCGPTVDSSFLSANQIVAYYGNPYAQQLGILGQHEPEELASMLRDESQKIDGLNGFRGVEPGFDLVYETAQPNPGNDGLFLQYVDPDTMTTWVDLACREHFFLFLDLQIGRSDIETEVRKVLPYLDGSNVHIAIDPEFTMGPGEVPGQVIGHVDAAQINAAQQILEDHVEEKGLPDKVLIVHQFDTAMITDPENIVDFPHVHVVIDMDGFGPKETKIRKFATFTAPAEHSGIKVFYHQDDPVLTDEEVEQLNPDVIIFQ
ncbi:MAG: hypothetical protein ABI559_04115 [Chloroflexota bacterium]